jgi:hypothetical protein
MKLIAIEIERKTRFSGFFTYFVAVFVSVVFEADKSFSICLFELLTSVEVLLSSTSKRVIEFCDFSAISRSVTSVGTSEAKTLNEEISVMIIANFIKSPGVRFYEVVITFSNILL